MRASILVGLGLVFALACGGGEPAVPSGVPAPSAPAAPAAPAAAEVPSGTPAAGAPAAGGSAPSAASAAAAWSPPNLPKCDDIALLVAYDFRYVQQNHCELCRGQTEWACELDWPTNDVPPCSIWDEYRNGIFAYYGYPFKKAEWREKFKSFYQENPAFDEKGLSPAAARNVALFRKMAGEKTSCG